MSTQNQKRNKLVIFSVSAGAGHLRAAQALVAATRQWYPETDAVHIDLMEHVPHLFRKVYADSYLKVVESHPALWGYLYDRSDQDKPNSGLNRLRRAIERLNTTKLASCCVSCSRTRSSAPTFCLPSCWPARSVTANWQCRSGYR